MSEFMTAGRKKVCLASGVLLILLFLFVCFFKGNTEHLAAGSLVRVGDKPGELRGSPQTSWKEPSKCHLQGRWEKAPLVAAPWVGAETPPLPRNEEKRPAKVCPGASAPRSSPLHTQISPAEFSSRLLRILGCSSEMGLIFYFTDEETEAPRRE